MKNDRRNPEISVLIPVYNEGEHIAASAKTIADQVKKVAQSYELIMVDDGSTDNTWEKLNEIAQKQVHCVLIRLSRNFGKEYALSAGLEQAAGNAVIVMDADLQHPPSMIAKMIDEWRKQEVGIVECVKSSRGKESFNNRIGSKLFYGMLKLLTGYSLEGASDYKLLDRKVVQAWSGMKERSLFFRGMTAWLGFQKVTLEFHVPPRVEGLSKWNLPHLVKLAANAVVSFTSLPLRFVSLIGFAFSVAAVLLGVQTLWNKINGAAVTGFTTVILLLLIIGSVVMISLGIIGEYIAAIYNEMKGRPRYVIEETVRSGQSGLSWPSEEDSESE